MLQKKLIIKTNRNPYNKINRLSMDYTRPSKKVKLGPLTVPPKPNTSALNWLFNTLTYENNPGVLYAFIVLLPKHAVAKELSEIAGACYTIHMFLRAKLGMSYPKIDDTSNDMMVEYEPNIGYWQSIMNYFYPPITIPEPAPEKDIFNDLRYKILWLFPGDGLVPHASFLQAVYGGNVIMVDPAYDEKKFTEIMTKGGVINAVPPNLYCYKDTMEHFLENFIPPKKTNLIVTVSIHSHHNSAVTWDLTERYKLPQVYISIPCCKHVCHFPKNVERTYDSYDQTGQFFRLGNPGILSPCNRIMIFENGLMPKDYKWPVLCKRF